MKFVVRIANVRLTNITPGVIQWFLSLIYVIEISASSFVYSLMHKTVIMT